MPEPPANGYQPSRGDIGELCCPCFFRYDEKRGSEDQEDVDDESPPVANDMKRQDNSGDTA